MTTTTDRKFGYVVLAICMTLIATLLFATKGGGIQRAFAITNNTAIHLYSDNTYCIGVKGNVDTRGNIVWLSQCSGPDTRVWSERNVPMAVWQGANDPGCGFSGGCVNFVDTKNTSQCLIANSTQEAALGPCNIAESFWIVGGTSNRLLRNDFWVGGYLQAAGDYNHANLYAEKNQCEGSPGCYDQWNNLQPGG